MNTAAAPFGWKRLCGSLVECPAEQEALRNVKNLDRDGWSAPAIAEWLAERGWSTTPPSLEAGLRLLAKHNKPTTLMEAWDER
jgi:hypothetical protein